MTKAELVEKIHAKAGLPTKAKAEEALDAVVASLREALADGESVTFTGFGTNFLWKDACSCCNAI